ncbi:MAG: hypothetical protein WBG39_06630 [Gordonia sp. (in: high G+C Gram-positive bacteria)]
MHHARLPYTIKQQPYSDTTTEPDIGDYLTRPDSSSLHRGSDRFTIASIHYPANDSTANPGRSPKLPRNTHQYLLAHMHTSIAASQTRQPHQGTPGEFARV